MSTLDRYLKMTPIWHSINISDASRLIFADMPSIDSELVNICRVSIECPYSRWWLSIKCPSRCQSSVQLDVDPVLPRVNQGYCSTFCCGCLIQSTWSWVLLIVLYWLECLMDIFPFKLHLLYEKGSWQQFPAFIKLNTSTSNGSVP